MNILPHDVGTEAADAARHYADLGWSLVVLEPGSKRPLAGRPWIRAQRERAGLTEVLALLKAHPRAGLGLVTGSVSGVAVVDVDDPGTALPVELPRGPFVESATPGHRHFYFAAPRPVPTVMNLFERKIELRGERAMTVLPPSAVNGRAYRWHGDPARGLPPLPAEILRAAKAAVKRMPMAQVLRGVLQGQRNVAAARVAGFFLHRSASSEEAWAATVTWNAQKNVPPLEVAELRTVFDSILARHRRWVGRWSPDRDAPGPLEEWVLRLAARQGEVTIWRLHRAMGGAVTREELEGAVRTLVGLGRMKMVGLTPRGAVSYRVAPVTAPSPQSPRRGAPEPSQTTTPLDCSTLHTLGTRNDKAERPSNHSTQLHTSGGVGPGGGNGHAEGVVAKVAEEEVTAPVSSMRLLHESLPNGELLVCQRRSDGALVPVFRGTLGEWMAWTPPELLRDESRLAEMLALGKLTGAARRDGEAERETRRRAG